MVSRQNTQSLTDAVKSIRMSDEHAVIRLPEVLAIFPVDRSTWYDGIKTSLYPSPIRIGKRSSGWRKSDVLALSTTSRT